MDGINARRKKQSAQRKLKTNERESAKSASRPARRRRMGERGGNQAIADKSLPGKGAAARAVIEKGWDSQATEFVHPARLESMRYHIDDSLAMNTAKGIVQRQPALNDEIRKLKG